MSQKSGLLAHFLPQSPHPLQQFLSSPSLLCCQIQGFSRDQHFLQQPIRALFLISWAKKACCLNGVFSPLFFFSLLRRPYTNSSAISLREALLVLVEVTPLKINPGARELCVFDALLSVLGVSSLFFWLSISF